MSKLLVSLIAFFALQMCSSPGSSEVSDDSYVTETVKMQSGRTNSPETATPEEVENKGSQKIIKDGELFLETQDIVKTKADLDSLVRNYKGYLAAENFQNNDYQYVVHYTVRIPNQSFDAFVKRAEKVGTKITNKQINARDVTTQFIDLKTRLANKEKYIERYRQLLKKANSIKEILEIERQIRNLEEELESTKGQLQYLSSQVQYSTLRVSITQKKDFKYTPQHRDSFWQKLKTSLSKGWFIFVDFMLILLTLWPFWVAISAIVFFIVRHNKRRRKRKFPTH